MGRFSSTLVSLVVFGWLALPPLHGAEQSAAALAESLQHKIDGIRDFSTDFVHAYTGGVLKKQIAERGHLLVKKPGKFRWDYITPEPKQFVSDGVKLYSYVPQDKQVIVSTVDKNDTTSTPALFLAGRGNLTHDFTVSLVDLPPGLPTGSLALKLVPKTHESDYDWLILAVDPMTLTLRGLVTTDSQGGTSTFTFLGFKENVGVADREFEFKMPRGVDVLSDSGR